MSTNATEEKPFWQWTLLAAVMAACAATNVPLVASMLKRAQLRSKRNFLLLALAVCDLLQCPLQLALWHFASCGLLVSLQFVVEVTTNGIVIALCWMQCTEEAQIAAKADCWRGLEPLVGLLFAGLVAPLLVLQFVSPNPAACAAKEIFAATWPDTDPMLPTAIMLLIRCATLIAVVVMQWWACPCFKISNLLPTTVRLMCLILDVYAIKLDKDDESLTTVLKLNRVLVVGLTIFNPLFFVPPHSDLANVLRTYFPSSFINSQGNGNLGDYPQVLDAPLPDGVNLQMEDLVTI